MGHGKFRKTKNLLKRRENQKGEKGRLVPKNQRHVHQFLDMYNAGEDAQSGN